MLVTLHRPVERRRPGAPARDRRGAHRRWRPARPVVFPIHPRTRARLRRAPGLRRLSAGRRALHRARRLPRLPLAPERGAGAIVTDSGGVQEEASALGVPCYTFRANTERPVTLSHGTNVLLGEDPAADRRRPPLALPPTPSRDPALGRPRRRALGGRPHLRARGTGRGGSRPGARLARPRRRPPTPPGRCASRTARARRVTAPAAAPRSAGPPRARRRRRPRPRRAGVPGLTEMCSGRARPASAHCLAAATRAASSWP